MRRPVERQHAVVPQQHHRRRGRLTGERAVLGTVDGRARSRVRRVVERADALEHAGAGARPGRRPRASSTSPARTASASARPEEAARSGHLEVDAGAPTTRRSSRALIQSVRTNPSNPHSPRRMPASSSTCSRAVRTVEPVVRGHHARARRRRARAISNGHEVDLAQRARVDHRVDGVALELGVVAGEVLDRGDDPCDCTPRTNAAGDRAREQRVLGVALEVAPRERRAVDVDRRRQQHAARLGVGLLAEHDADPLDQRRIPGRAERGAARHADRRSRSRGRTARARARRWDRRSPGSTGSRAVRSRRGSRSRRRW